LDSLGIEGAWVRTPRIHHDDRGSFLEAFHDEEFAADVGYRLDVAQVNCSVSRRGVLRGVHFADVPPGQAKYVSCMRGAIIDVVVDLRVGSPGFGSWKAVRLDDQNRRSVFIAEGLGHAFMALTDECTVVYMCSTPYAPGREHGVHPLDPAIGISWPADVEPVLSEKDAAAPSLASALDSGLLPRYADCIAHAARLCRGSQQITRPEASASAANP
jgi:dTDP-4-dehydrorhamnose 3,5-epimerase